MAIGPVRGSLWWRTLITRNPFAVAWRRVEKSVVKVASIQRCRESLPRFFCTTRYASLLRSRRGIHVSRSSCRAGLPMRIGGLDRIVRKTTSEGISSAVTARTLSRPRASALRRTRSSARSLTSRAQMRACGACIASVREMAPQPHPRSRKSPPGGASGEFDSSTSVPRSMRSGLKTPFAVVTSTSRPSSVTRSRRVCSGLAGAALK